MSRIHHSYLTGHIDLDKIVRIGDAEFVNRMGNGGFFVRCIIDVQLRDQPLQYIREVDDSEAFFDMDKGYRVLLLDGSLIDPCMDKRTPKGSYVCVSNLQDDIDRLVYAWKNNE